MRGEIGAGAGAGAVTGAGMATGAGARTAAETGTERGVGTGAAATGAATGTETTVAEGGASMVRLGEKLRIFFFWRETNILEISGAMGDGDKVGPGGGTHTAIVIYIAIDMGGSIYLISI